MSTRPAFEDGDEFAGRVVFLVLPFKGFFVLRTSEGANQPQPMSHRDIEGDFEGTRHRRFTRLLLDDLVDGHCLALCILELGLGSSAAAKRRRSTENVIAGLLELCRAAQVANALAALQHVPRG
jgi:hypothetical protein